MITSKTSTWFETKMRFPKVMENGTVKKVTETYVTDSLSWTEAEAKAIEIVSNFVNGEFEIIGINKAPYKEVFFTDNETDDTWFKVKVAFITIDENTATEKRTNVVYLVQASNIDTARKNIDEAMKGAMIEYKIGSLSETKIVDVYKE